MIVTNLDLAALTYPSAEVLNTMEFEESYNVLLRTPDAVERVWNWYSRRLDAGTAVARLGRYDSEASTNPHATIRGLRNMTRKVPRDRSECPQLVVARKNYRTIAVLIDRRPDEDQTYIALFILVERATAVITDPQVRNPV